MVVFWGGAVDACYQHSLLDSELQPKELIAAAMHTSNAVSDVSGYISGLGTASSAAASSASALRTTAASRSMKLAAAAGWSGNRKRAKALERRPSRRIIGIQFFDEDEGLRVENIDRYPQLELLRFRMKSYLSRVL